jgi:hypothetical protein
MKTSKMEKDVEAMRSLELKIGIWRSSWMQRKTLEKPLQLATTQQRKTLVENAKQKLIIMKFDKVKVYISLQLWILH